MKAVRRLLLWVAVAAAVSALLVFLLLGTDRGFRIGLRLARDHLPPALALEGVEGNLWQGLEIARLRWEGEGGQLEIRRLEWRWAPADLLRGRLRVQRLRARSVRLQLPSTASPEGPGPMRPPRLALPLAVELEALEVEQLSWAGRELGRLRLAARWQGTTLEVESLSLERPSGGARLRGALETRDAWPLVLELRAAGRLEGRVVEGEARIAGDMERLEVELESRGALPLSAKGTLVSLLAAPRLDLELATPGLETGLVPGGPPHGRLAGRLQVAGTPERLRLDGRLELKLPRLRAPLVVEPELELAGRRLQLAPLRLALEGSRLELRGLVMLEAEPRWSLQVNGDALDPSLLFPAYPGDLDLQATVEGRWTGAPQGLVVVDRLAGRLRGHPVRGSGRLGLERGGLAVRGLEVVSGGNRLELEGRAGDRLDLGWRLAAPALERLFPGLRGSLEGTGRLSGTPAVPRIVARLAGRGLVLRGVEAETLDLSLDYRGEPGASLDGHLELAGLRTADAAPARVAVHLAGMAEAPRLELEAEQPDGRRSLRLALAGRLEEGSRFRGRVERLDLASPESGPWRLAAVAPVQVDWPGLRLDPLCLVQGSDRLCLEYRQRAPGRWKGSIDLDLAAPKLLEPLLGGGWELEGRIRGHAALEAAGAVHVGMFRLEAPVARARHRALEEAELVLDLGGSRLEGTLGTGGLEAELALPLAGLGGLEGELRLPGWQPGRPAVRQSLEGRLEGTLEDLEFLERLVPALAAVRGSLELDLAPAGTLAAPRLSGRLRTRGLAFELPEPGLVVEEAELDARGDESGRLHLRGFLRAGEGRLRLDGLLSPDPGAGWPARIHLSSSRLPLVDTAEYRVLADAELDLLHDRRGTRVEGRVHVPEALIAPRALPEGAVAPSSDVIIEGTAPPEPLPLFVRVDLSLGEEVRVRAFDLEGRVTGRITLIENPGQPTLGRGELKLLDGSYRLFGRRLEIRRGRLLFADGPVTDPGIDIELVRRIPGEGVEAGARLDGTLRRPAFRLFSEPPLPDADILSYLTTGRPARSAGRGRNLSDQALLMAGGRLLDRLGEEAGLDQLRLEEGEDEALSLTLGYWLSPRLYMEYVAGLRGDGNTVRLRYDLGGRLQLQTEAGRTRAVDLFYTFDR